MGKIYLLLLSTCFFVYSTLANEVRVEFNMRDRQVTEGEGNCDVLLIKAGKQTQDINVRVRALTVEQYEQLTGKIFDETFPNAEVEDFVAYDEVFTFEQDGGIHQERDIEVEIVDDDINEAAEEFLLFFDIVDSDFVDDEIITSVERNPTRCRIMNDDALILGFDRDSYTVPEMSTLEDFVFITKQDNTATEQDIEIEISTITTMSRGAILGEDFITPNGMGTFTIIFPASQNKIGVPIVIVDDDVTGEVNENFLLQFSTGSSGITLLEEEITLARINIEDTTPTPVAPSSVPVPTSTSSPLPSPAPSSTPLILPPPMFTVIPVSTTVPQPTNFPQDGGDPDCDDKDDNDLGLAIGITFLITFLVTALCAVIIIIFIVIADRKRRERYAEHQQLS